MKLPIKQYAVWLWLLCKRLLKKPAFILLFPIFLLMGLGAEWLQQGERNSVCVGIIQEGTSGQEAEQITGQTAFMEALEQDSILTFVSYDTKKELIQAVETRKADCGFIIPQRLSEQVVSQNWQNLITVYTAPDSIMTEFAKERIAGAVFRIYAEESYVNYLDKTTAFAPAKEKGILQEEITAFAKEAYEEYLTDGSTFAFIYQDDGQMEIETKPIQHRAALPLRGILAVGIFLSGLCGLLLDCEDRQSRRFAAFAPPIVTTMVNVWIPAVCTSIMTAAVLWLTGNMGNIYREITGLLFYQFLIVLYCSIIRTILKRQETIAAAIPILTLASLICCPVLIRLALYLPAFSVVEKLFPVTYYLGFF